MSYGTPLFADQADAVAEAEKWLGILVMLVRVRCGGKCRATVLTVALGAAPAPEDPDNLLVLAPEGPFVQGTRRHPNADWMIGAAKGTRRLTRCPCPPGECVVPEHELTGQPPKKVSKVDTTDHWTALLDQVTTKTLPVWCDRHGNREVSVAELKSRAAAVVADVDRKAEWMETIPSKFTSLH